MYSRMIGEKSVAQFPDSKVFEISARNSLVSSLILDPLLPRGVVRNLLAEGAGAGVVFNPALLLAPNANAMLAAAAAGAAAVALLFAEVVDAALAPKLKVGFA